MIRLLPILVTLAFLLIHCFSFAQRWPKRELRAAWIATVVNIDWPSQKGLSVARQQEEFVELLDTLQHVGMNAVIVQVRPVADAFYPSSYEPWSEYLSGMQGEPAEPYYNPLTFMIQEARKRGLEFHAWFNPYRASMNGDLVYAPTHPIRKHPEWFVEYGGKYYYDPGNREAQEYVLQSIMETVKHYDIDAVHFDDYFYPYRIANLEFPDSCSYESNGAGFVTRDEWRRHNVDFFVEELSKRIKVEKPHVKFGISPFGVWRNIDKDPAGSKTRAGQTNYDDLFADVLKWLKYGWIDYVTPQLYWHIGFEVADYKVLAEWWSNHTYGKHLYIGQGVYRLGGKGWEDASELVRQIYLNRSHESIQGSMYFSAKAFLQNKEGVNERMAEIYSYKSLVPVMDWIPSEVPAAPVLLKKVSGNPQAGVTLQWKDTLSRSTAYYVLYRFNKKEPVDLEDATAIMAIVPREPYAIQSWRDDKTGNHSAYNYVVTAVSRLHHESTGSHPVMVRTRGKRRDVKIVPR